MADFQASGGYDARIRPGEVERELKAEIDRLREAIEEHRDSVEASFRTPADGKLYAALSPPQEEE